MIETPKPEFVSIKPSLVLRGINFLLSYAIKNLIQNPSKLKTRRRQWNWLASRFPIAQSIVITPFIINAQHAALSIQAEWIDDAINADYKPIILYLHGGGYCSGSLKTHRSYLSYFCKITGARILSIDYRLAPEAPYPAALDDAYIAFEWLLQNYPAHNIFVAGESAGSGLALALVLKLKSHHQKQPKAVICLSPWLDLSHTQQTLNDIKIDDKVLPIQAILIAAQYYYGSCESTTAYISPIYGDYTNICPIFMLMGDQEIFLTDGKKLLSKLHPQKINIKLEVWQGMFHAWPYLAPFLPESRQASQRIKKYIDEVSGASIQ